MSDENATITEEPTPAEAPSEAPAEQPIPEPEPPRDPCLIKALEINHDVRAAESRYLAAAEEAKRLKKAFEAAQDRLSRYLSDLDMPLFDRPKAEARAPEPEAWRAFPLAGVEQFPEAALEAFEAVEVRTLGELADWSAFKKLTDLAGVGDATAEKVEGALLAFWAAHPEFAEPEIKSDSAASAEVPAGAEAEAVNGKADGEPRRGRKKGGA